jgi:hypothetical protein
MPLAGRNRSLVLATSRYGEGIRVNAHDIEKGGEGRAKTTISIVEHGD